ARVQRDQQQQSVAHPSTVPAEDQQVQPPPESGPDQRSQHAQLLISRGTPSSHDPQPHRAADGPLTPRAAAGRAARTSSGARPGPSAGGTTGSGRTPAASPWAGRTATSGRRSPRPRTPARAPAGPPGRRDTRWWRRDGAPAGPPRRGAGGTAPG